MELNQIQQLLAIERRGTLSAAAEELHISQPALTRSMQKLEGEWGIELFNRSKNRVELNEAGRLAVEYARPILSAAENLAQRMDAYRRSRITVSIGSCAPGPMWLIASELLGQVSEKILSTELQTADALIEGLLSEVYQLIILDRPLCQENAVCRKYLTERLFISLPAGHPLASKAKIGLSELSQQTMLLYSDLGVWEHLREEKMPDIRFIRPKEKEVFADLIHASDLPNFTTNLMRKLAPSPPNRIEIPVSDPEAAIPFYLCVLKKNRNLLDSVSEFPL